MDTVDKIIAYEQGDMDQEETIALYQELIDSGLVWQLQGHYGRTAARLIQVGACHETTKPSPSFKVKSNRDANRKRISPSGA
jgi:hypothetical protein